MSLPVLVDARQLAGGYGKRAVLGPIDLAIRSNDAIALVGPNGVGKSTLLKTLAGVIAPVSGMLTYQGRPITKAPVNVHANNGLVFVGEHRANVLRSLTVEENLRLAGRRHGSNPDEAAELFPRLGERWRQLAGTLSGGELQMLSLSMALALRPRCLLLDEPSAGLAPIALDDIRRALAVLRSTELSIVVAEQRPDVARGLCDQVAMVAQGTLTFIDSGSALSNEELMARYFSDGS